MPKALKVPQFDNLDDVNGKFHATICMLKGKAVYVKSCGYQHNDNGAHIPGKFNIAVTQLGVKESITCKLDDPEFDYKNYNIGYANYKDAAVWWFRKPMKQFKQGLRKEQMQWLSTHPYFVLNDGFIFVGPVVKMLQNEYPPMDVIREILVEGTAHSVAWHRDFALSYDHVHEDYVLEYRGKKVGASMGGKLDQFKLMAEYKHLAEALQEALG
jgi:hypothetical protein